MGQEDTGEDYGEAVVIVARPKALLLGFHDLSKKKWIPKSQLHDNSEIHDNSEEGETGNTVLTTWLSEQEDTDKWDDWEFED